MVFMPWKETLPLRGIGIPAIQAWLRERPKGRRTGVHPQATFGEICPRRPPVAA
jgi:hypothetical protein